MRAHSSDISQLLQFTSCVMSHIHPHLLLQFSIRFQITLLPSLHSNSWAATLLMPTSTSKLQVFFKVKCHIYCCIYVFLNHLICIHYVNLCHHFYWVSVFLKMCHRSFLSIVLLTSFFSWVQNCTICQTWWFFRNSFDCWTDCNCYSEKAFTKYFLSYVWIRVSGHKALTMVSGTS